MIFKNIFDRHIPRATKRVLVIIAVSVLLLNMEAVLQNWIPFAALLSVMSIGYIILNKREHYAHEMSAKLGKLWIIAEIILFTMVGAQVNIEVAFHSGVAGVLIILTGLIARSLGSYICLIGSNLNMNERMFVVISYLPKATVQAAIGGSPILAMQVAGMNTAPGDTILAVAVLSILLTAPLGAWAISVVGKRVLELNTDPIKTEAYYAAMESKNR